MWSYQRNKGNVADRWVDRKKQEKAVPPSNTSAYTVPNYRRGSPYSKEAVPTYTDRISYQAGEHPYDTITAQQAALPFGTRPPADKPASEWSGYEEDNYTRSIKFEHVLNGDEGPEFGAGIPKQRRSHMAPNPYNRVNIVNRPQRTPAEWSFVRPFDRYVLGRRTLNGSHYSEAQTATDNNRTALQGMVPPLRRRSTFRLEPVQYGENSVSASASSMDLNARGVVTSPVAGFTPRSFRLG